MRIVLARVGIGDSSIPCLVDASREVRFRRRTVVVLKVMIEKEVGYKRALVAESDQSIGVRQGNTP